MVAPDLGILAENTEEGWKNALEQMVIRPEKREQFRKNLFAFLQEHNSLDGFRNNLTAHFPEISETRTKSTGCGSLKTGKVIYRLLRPLDKVYFLAYYTTHGQLKNRLG